MWFASTLLSVVCFHMLPMPLVALKFFKNDDYAKILIYSAFGHTRRHSGMLVCEAYCYLLLNFFYVRNMQIYIISFAYPGISLMSVRLM